ncbi:signal transduction histidine kinase [Actinoplanes campanulatus]|uniref:histidine kinase n=1 Tax=Actinoplanes campanulatus TaxID=113559 RepID=A0A7W5AHQ8_9ACTN|nr:ATP-binding protein [Actinoplanes campanulatus]MBB3096315.1 signal transduction histidine kinase [Actinoplanes campanulatus]
MTDAAEPEALASVFPDDPHEPAATGSGNLGSSGHMVTAGSVSVDQGQALRAVLDSLDVAVLGYDRNGRVILMNPAARALVEEVGEPTGDDAVPTGMLLFDTSGRQMGGERHPVSLALRGESVRHVEVCVRAADSPARMYLAQGGPVTGAGRLAAVLAFHDVTLQSRAKQLNDCVARVSAILGEPGPAGLIIATAVRTVGVMLGWAASEFWSVDRVSQVIQRRNRWQADDSHSTGLDRVGDLLNGVGLAGRAWQSRTPVWVTDLVTDPLTAAQTDWGPLRAALAVPIPSGSSVLGVLICYSDQDETPDDMRTAIHGSIAVHLGEFLERRRADDSSTALEHSRDEYITLVGHELRTPLTSIQANAEMLRAEPDMPADERQQMLEVIHRRAEELNRLVATLLDVAGTRAGHMSLHCRRIDLAEVVRAAVGRNDTAAAIDLGAPVALPVNADPDRIRVAVEELLRNARTWAPPDSRISVTVRGEQRAAVVTVSNSGPPIPADQHARVFELFYRGDELRHGGVPGCGLGLTLARAIVEQHGGTLTLSEPDEITTTFTIRLPRPNGQEP